MPRLEQMVNAFTLDQRTGENRAKFRRPHSGLEALHVYPAREIEKLLLWKSYDAECVRGFLRKHDDEIGQLVFFEVTFTVDEQTLAPFMIPVARRWACFRQATDLFSLVTVPGGNFDHRRNAATLCDMQRLQAIARPTMEHVVAPGLELARRDPADVLLFCSVVLRPLK